MYPLCVEMSDKAAGACTAALVMAAFMWSSCYLHPLCVDRISNGMDVRFVPCPIPP